MAVALERKAAIKIYTYISVAELINQLSINNCILFLYLLGVEMGKVKSTRKTHCALQENSLCEYILALDKINTLENEISYIKSRLGFCESENIDEFVERFNSLIKRSDRDVEYYHKMVCLHQAKESNVRNKIYEIVFIIDQFERQFGRSFYCKSELSLFVIEKIRSVSCDLVNTSSSEIRYTLEKYRSNFLNDVVNYIEGEMHNMHQSEKYNYYYNEQFNAGVQFVYRKLLHYKSKMERNEDIDGTYDEVLNNLMATLLNKEATYECAHA
ncbi:hypothetical protein H7Q97_00710 [Ochrobactrum sp. CM-21-5]|nr:hypothetical protein [Ochrobactrum sp. CM-21-5]MBC2883919.1 hypothetical protein [Ochrobactrum sp. CM-21-5]